MYLLGAITVDAIVNQAEAAARLGRNPDELWQSDYHIIALTALLELESAVEPFSASSFL